MEAYDIDIALISSWSSVSKSATASLDLAEGAVFCETVKRQMSSVLAVAVACKMRLAGPDSSRLVLQSLLPSSSSSGNSGAGASGQAEGKMVGLMDRGDYATESTAARHPLQRRYSASQLGQTGDTSEGMDTHTDQLLQMFSSRLQSSSSIQNNPGNRDLATVAETGLRGVDKPSTERGLTRQGSSPVLSSLAHTPSATAGAGKSVGGIVQGYLTRGASSSALYVLGDTRQSNTTALSTTTSTPANNTQAASDTASSGPLQAFGSSSSGSSSVDSTDAGSNRGFGVLARTRQFGAWLGQVTHGERIEVTKKDINVFAPTSF